MKSTFFTVLLLVSAFLGGPAMAQGTYTPHIDQARQANGARIQAGLASGFITPSEAQMLIRRDRDIAQRENFYKANGSATQPERQQLRTELNALSADVDRMMANGQVVHPPGHANSTPGIDGKKYQIVQRIEEGLRTGRITPRETYRLQSREREIARHEVFFKSDGVVTRQEQRQLHDELNALRNEVERLINDARGNPG